ncbi:General transcription factor 3C polypeptide 2, variant 2 [Entomophthora muscae]|uniref:General transcription factor 3C polypeptide 2, variant 2 n=1 Tax=Entomophthora muscae TaxID=34485 RepID=A0ACC2U5K2_9FUNG|nr:General transcription factor 3C polypeptide 2, variant 2 [Entomophthora muscae]
MGKKITPKKSITRIKKEPEDQTPFSCEPSRYSLRSSSQNTPINSPQKKATLATTVADLDSIGIRTRSQRKLKDLTPKLSQAKENNPKQATQSKTPDRIKLTPQKAKTTPPQRVKSRKEQITEFDDIGPGKGRRSPDLIDQLATKRDAGSSVQVARKRGRPKKDTFLKDSALDLQGVENSAVTTDEPQLISSVKMETLNVPLTKKRGRQKKNTSIFPRDQTLNKECAESSVGTTNEPHLISSVEKENSNVPPAKKRGRTKNTLHFKNEISDPSTSGVGLFEAEQPIQPDTSKRARPSRTATRKPIIRDSVSPLPKRGKPTSKYVPRVKKAGLTSYKHSIPSFVARTPIKPSDTASALFHLVHNGPLQAKAGCFSNQYLTPGEALPYMDSTDLAPNTFCLPGSWGKAAPVQLTPGQALKGPAILLNTGLNVLAMEYSPCGHYLAVGGSFLDQKVVISSAAPLCIPNGLQLWRLRGDTPELAMVICHSFGPVTSLSWLPSGINKDAPFVGLLAFASTSGKAYIVQVPKPPAPAAFLDLNGSPLLIATLEIPNAPLHCLKWAPSTHPACLVVGSNHGSMAGYSLLKPLFDHMSGCKVDFIPRFFCQSHRGILQWVDFCIRSDGQGDLVILSAASDGNLMYLDWNNPRRTMRMLNMKVAPSPAQAFSPVGSDDGLYSLAFFTSANFLVLNQRKKFPLDLSTSRNKVGLIEDDHLLCAATSPLHCMMAAGFQKGLIKLITVSTCKDRLVSLG